MAVEHAKELIIKVATELRAELEAGEVSIGVISFTVRASVVVPLNQSTANVDAFVAAVDAIKYDGSFTDGSNAHEAFRLARTMLRMEPRPGLAHAVLLSDGHVYAKEFARDDTGARELLVAELQDNPLWDAFSRLKAPRMAAQVGCSLSCATR